MIKSLIGFILMTSSDVLNRPISSVPIFPQCIEDRILSSYTLREAALQGRLCA